MPRFIVSRGTIISNLPTKLQKILHICKKNCILQEKTGIFTLITQFLYNFDTPTPSNFPNSLYPHLLSPRGRPSFPRGRHTLILTFLGVDTTFHPPHQPRHSTILGVDIPYRHKKKEYKHSFTPPSLLINYRRKFPLFSMYNIAIRYTY